MGYFVNYFVVFRIFFNWKCFKDPINRKRLEDPLLIIFYFVNESCLDAIFSSQGSGISLKKFKKYVFEKNGLDLHNVISIECRIKLNKIFIEFVVSRWLLQ